MIEKSVCNLMRLIANETEGMLSNNAELRSIFIILCTETGAVVAPAVRDEHDMDQQIRLAQSALEQVRIDLSSEGQTMQ
jgi:hypothetical protein